jgi:hypothetical protein
MTQLYDEIFLPLRYFFLSKEKNLHKCHSNYDLSRSNMRVGINKNKCYMKENDRILLVCIEVIEKKVN